MNEEHPASPPVDEPASPPRSDLLDAALWMLFGAAVLVGSLRMDRLESQGASPYTAPGLLPGLLGLAMLLLGTVLALRSWRRGARHQAPAVPPADQGERRRRIAIVIASCLLFGVVLVGHGLPFWAASALYVSGSILVLRRISRDPAERRLGARAWLLALVIGVGAAAITQLVFQELFLVRLP